LLWAAAGHECPEVFPNGFLGVDFNVNSSVEVPGFERLPETVMLGSGMDETHKFREPAVRGAAERQGGRPRRVGVRAAAWMRKAAMRQAVTALRTSAR
jgi:hypothetical protein